MTHRDASRTPTSRREADRAMPAVRRPAPTDAQRGGFTESELALIHATADANNTFICIECSVVPDGTFPPTPDGALRPEVARILASLRKTTPPQTQGRAAGFGTPDRAAGRADARAAEPAAAGEQLAVRADAPAPSRAAAAVAYDRQAHDLEAVRRLASASDTTTEGALDAAAVDALETRHG